MQIKCIKLHLDIFYTKPNIKMNISDSKPKNRVKNEKRKNKVKKKIPEHNEAKEPKKLGWILYSKHTDGNNQHF